MQNTLTVVYEAASEEQIWTITGKVRRLLRAEGIRAKDLHNRFQRKLS